MASAALFAAMYADDHEGIVAKRLDAPYRADKRPEWAKVKNRDYSRRETVVGGPTRDAPMIA